MVAFRFIELGKVPQEVVARLADRDAEVRSWAALVLGEIGDPAVVPALMAAAENTRLDRATRANAIVSIRSLKATAALDLMKRLTADSDKVVAHHAAAAVKSLTPVEPAPQP